MLESLTKMDPTITFVGKTLYFLGLSLPYRSRNKAIGPSVNRKGGGAGKELLSSLFGGLFLSAGGVDF